MKQTKYTEREVDAAYDKGIREGKRLAHEAIEAAYMEGFSDAVEDDHLGMQGGWNESEAKKELGE